jgi:hypothetical protein
MRAESSRNFICITVAVVALALALRHDRSPQRARSQWLHRASYPENNPQHHVFGDLAAVVEIFHIGLTAQGKTEQLLAGAVRANFFEMIGVEPVMGRAFRAGEDTGCRVVMLSYRLWQRRFHGAASAVGQHIRLEGEAYRVIGILPSDFTWNNGETDVWLPCGWKTGSGAESLISQVHLALEHKKPEWEPEI